MKYLTAFAGLVLPLTAIAAGPPAWLNPVPPNLSGSTEQIPDTSFFEVPVSKFDAAASQLQDKVFVRQSAGDAAYFGQIGFACPGSSKPYLVRAIYDNGGTGAFGLVWVGNALIVKHGSLGAQGTVFKSALFACLSKEPTQVYSSISGAI